MGFTKKVLSKKELDEKSVFYSDKFQIELCESFHIHIRNFRLEFSIEEWKSFAKGIIYSYLRWFRLGKPGYISPNDNITLHYEKINPVAGFGEDSVLENTMRIELQQFTDYIHFHFRTSKYEFTVDEYLEFAEQVQIAANYLKNDKIMQDYPKRIGYHHIRQANNRVTESKNLGGFDTHGEQFPNEKIQSHNSLEYDENMGEWVNQIDYIKNPTKVKIKQKSFLNKIFTSSIKKTLDWFFS
tara:strand:+ start:132 stop:854 length:723 start_codon:yes stop_codon:yes gene_type:complete